jgi:hypothetical protein
MGGVLGTLTTQEWKAEKELRSENTQFLSTWVLAESLLVQLICEQAK